MVSSAQVTTSQEPLSDEEVVARVLAGETGMFEFDLLSRGPASRGQAVWFGA